MHQRPWAYISLNQTCPVMSLLTNLTPVLNGGRVRHLSEGGASDTRFESWTGTPFSNTNFLREGGWGLTRRCSGNPHVRGLGIGEPKFACNSRDFHNI